MKQHKAHGVVKLPLCGTTASGGGWCGFVGCVPCRAAPQIAHGLPESRRLAVGIHTAAGAEIKSPLCLSTDLPDPHAKLCVWSVEGF